MIIRETFKYFAIIYKLLRNKYWKWTYNEKKILNLSILKEDQAKFYMYGDIARILFSDQHIVTYKKSFEYDTLEMFRDYLKPDSVVLDIGANIGLFSLLGSKYLKGNGVIYAFEPSTKTYHFLEKNLKINNITNVKPFKIAFSNKVMEVVMTAPPKALNANFGDSFNQIREVNGQKNNSDTIETTLLDDFIEDNGIENIDLIKIDIEGAELMCFKGAQRLLNSTNKPVIMLESFEPHCNSFGHNSLDVLVFLHEAGYELKQYDYAQWIAIPKK